MGLCLIWHLSIEVNCRRRTAAWKACCRRKTKPTRVPFNSQARGAFTTIQSDVLWSAMLSSAQACWLSGFVQTSVGMNDSNASLDLSELDEVDKSLGNSVSNASNASEDELTSQWGIPHHPIARAMVCHAVFGPTHRFLRRACWWSGR